MLARTVNSLSVARSVSGSRPSARPAGSTGRPLSVTSSRVTGLTSTNVPAPGRAHRNRSTVVDANSASPVVRSRSTSYESTVNRAARSAASVRERLGMRFILPVRRETWGPVWAASRCQQRADGVHAGHLRSHRPQLEGQVDRRQHRLVVGYRHAEPVAQPRRHLTPPVVGRAHVPLYGLRKTAWSGASDRP